MIKTFMSKIDIIFVVFIFNMSRENLIESIEFSFNLNIHLKNNDEKKTIFEINTFKNILYKKC